MAVLRSRTRTPFAVALAARHFCHARPAHHGTALQEPRRHGPAVLFRGGNAGGRVTFHCQGRRPRHGCQGVAGREVLRLAHAPPAGRCRREVWQWAPCRLAAPRAHRGLDPHQRAYGQRGGRSGEGSGGACQRQTLANIGARAQCRPTPQTQQEPRRTHTTVHGRRGRCWTPMTPSTRVTASRTRTAQERCLRASPCRYPRRRRAPRARRRRHPRSGHPQTQARTRQPLPRLLARPLLMPTPSPFAHVLPPSSIMFNREPPTHPPTHPPTYTERHTHTSPHPTPPHPTPTVADVSPSPPPQAPPPRPRPPTRPNRATPEAANPPPFDQNQFFVRLSGSSNNDNQVN